MRTEDLDRLVVTGGASTIGYAMDWGRKLVRSDLDLLDFEGYERVLDPLCPSGILHLATLDIRRCQEDPILAVRTNVLATHRLARYAESHAIPFVFLSTASVFYGERGRRFSEEDSPSPLHVLGQTKCLAEAAVGTLSSPWLVVRTGWVFGCRGAQHPKFIDVFIDRTRAGLALQAHDRQEGSPVYIQDLLSALKALLLQEETGIVHVVNQGVATPRDVALAVASGLKSSSAILDPQEAQSSPIPNLFGAGTGTTHRGPDIPRSPSEAIVSSRVRLRPWTEALAEHLHRI